MEREKQMVEQEKHRLHSSFSRLHGDTRYVVIIMDYLITHDPQPASRADMALEGLLLPHALIQPTCS